MQCEGVGGQGDSLERKIAFLPSRCLREMFCGLLPRKVRLLLVKFTSPFVGKLKTQIETRNRSAAMG